MLRRRIEGYACTTCIRSRIVRGGCHVLVCFACRASWSSLPGAACMCTSSPSRLLASYRIGDGPGRSRNLVGRQNIVHGARVCCMHALTYLHTSSAKASFFPPLRAFFFWERAVLFLQCTQEDVCWTQLVLPKSMSFLFFLFIVIFHGKK